MVSNKNRLYIGLHARGAGRFHWSLIIGPKNESAKSEGRRIHATNSMAMRPDTGRYESYWRHENTETTMLPTNKLLVRILVAKIADEDGLRVLLANHVPMRPEQEGWNCVGWVQEAFEKASSHEPPVLGTVVGGRWQAVRDAAMRYVESKVADHRFDGLGTLPFGEGLPPTWDLLRQCETVP